MSSQAPALDDLDITHLETFTPGCIEPRFGRDFLLSFAKQGATLSRSDWLRYRLSQDIKLNGSSHGQLFKQKFYDTTFNFCLTHDETLVASVGFELDGQAMNIWQLQGVKGQLEWLRPIKWERALVRYTVRWATLAGVSEVSVVSVDHNSWAATHGHLDRARGKLLYDVTARRCGFKRGDDGYYIRWLKDQPVQ